MNRSTRILARSLTAASSGIVVRSPIALLSLLFALSGCDSPTLPRPPSDAAIATDGTVFTVEDFGVMRQGRIPHTFTNPTEDPIYISHCGGEFGMTLQRKVGNHWETFWLFLPDACLSLPPIEIGPGETHSAEFFFFGFGPDDYRGPTLRSPVRSGSAGTDLSSPSIRRHPGVTRFPRSFGSRMSSNSSLSDLLERERPMKSLPGIIFPSLIAPGPDVVAPTDNCETCT